MRIEWFYDDIVFTGLSKDRIESVIVGKKDLLEKIIDHVRDVEGEAYFRIIDLRPQPGYTSRYIDVMVLVNTLLLRLVRERSERPEDVEKKVTMLGEIVFGETSGEHEHHHEHTGSSMGKRVSIEWYRDMLEYLQVTDDEVNEYTRLVRDSVERILKCISYSYETPNVEYLFVLKGWRTDTPQGQVFKHVSVHVVDTKPYLIYSEEYEQFGEHMIYYFRLGRILVE